MAQVRVPKSAVKMLAIRLKDPAATPTRSDSDAFFPTNAHMVMFAASVGFEEKRFDKKPEFFKNNPDPIDLGIFQRQDLYQMIQCLGIAKEKTHEVANDENRLAEILEGYASAGFEIMTKWYEEAGSHTFLFTVKLANEIIRRTT